MGMIFVRYLFFDKVVFLVKPLLTINCQFILKEYKPLALILKKCIREERLVIKKILAV